MDLSVIISATTIASVLVLGGALYYTGRARGGASKQLPVWKTNTPPKVNKPRRWREVIVEAQREAPHEQLAA